MISRFLSLLLNASLCSMALLFCQSIAFAKQPLQSETDHPFTDINTIRGIISYTRWPTPPSILKVCIVSEKAPDLNVNLIQQIARSLPPEWPATVTLLSQYDNPSDPSIDCHIIYISYLTQEHLQQLVKLVTNKPILTIGQNTELCSAGIMFCLDEGKSTRFIVNLDAISRSPVRINPQVLRLSHRSSTPR